MSDDQDLDRPGTTVDAPADAGPSGAPATRPGAPRSSTSRARRIGGRPVTPAAPSRPASEPVSEPVSEPSSVPSSEPSSVAAQPGAVRFDKPRAAAAPADEPADTDGELDSNTDSDTDGDLGRAHEPRRDPGPRRSPWAWAPAAVLGVAALVLAVLVIVFAVKDDSTTSASPTLSAADTAARQQVLAAAKGCVVRVNSYDYRTFAADEQQALKCTTGQYTADFKKTFEGVIMKYGPKLHATQTAQIDTAGIQQVSPDGKQWTVLLFGQLTATNNTSAKTGRVDPLAIQVVMQKVGSKWLIEKLAGA